MGWWKFSIKRRFSWDCERETIPKIRVIAKLIIYYLFGNELNNSMYNDKKIKNKKKDDSIKVINSV